MPLGSRYSYDELAPPGGVACMCERSQWMHWQDEREDGSSEQSRKPPPLPGICQCARTRALTIEMKRSRGGLALERTGGGRAVTARRGAV